METGTGVRGDRKKQPSENPHEFQERSGTIEIWHGNGVQILKENVTRRTLGLGNTEQAVFIYLFIFKYFGHAA